jgi:hypothetical protein
MPTKMVPSPKMPLHTKFIISYIIMRAEIFIFGITAFLMANIYTDGKYWKLLQSNQKYYKMGAIALAGFVLYVLVKKFPSRAVEIIKGSNEYLKYMPVDKTVGSFAKETMGIINPILDFTAKQDMYNGGGHVNMNRSVERVMTSGQAGAAGTQGQTKTKRSVSETKKKFVASRQSWKCGDCGEQLSAWFEVDHKIRLEYGGSNHVDNLVALCRECHGRKTTMENL